MERFGLRDDQWDRIKDILPGGEGHVGGTAPDNRLLVEAILYRFRTGIAWRDLPVRFGYWKSGGRQCRPGAESGEFAGTFRRLACAPAHADVRTDGTTRV